MDRLKKRALRAAGGSRALALLTGGLIVTSYFAAMHLSKHSALLLASAPLLTPSGAEDVDIGWHAPSERDVNDLDSALNSEGTYGFTFDSSETPEGEYGRYNYCNMPHVRRTEYVKPGPEYELQYVELVG